MKRNSNKLTAAERRLLIQKIVQDCKDIASAHIRLWKPINPAWPTIEGVAYLRLSTDQQVMVEKGSLEQQIHIAINEAENRSVQDQINYRIKYFYIEPGLTGRNDHRPQFNRMNRDIRNGTVNFVIFKELARIARDAQIWKAFFNLCIAQKCEIMIRGFPFNPNDPSSILQLDILAAFAEYESNQISKRTRESNFSAMVSSGKFNSTHLVLGLDQQIINDVPRVGFYVKNDSELKTVTWIMETFLKYNSHQKTLEELKARGIKNKNGREFKKNSLQTLLTNQKYIGKWRLNSDNKDKPKQKLLAYDQYAEIDLPHGCVIDADLFERVQLKVTELAGNKSKNLKLNRVYVLAGLLKAPDEVRFHGTSGHSGYNKGERAYYYTNRKEGKSIPADVVEDCAKQVVASILKRDKKVQDAIIKRAKDNSEAGNLLSGQISRIQTELDELEKQKRQLNARLDFLIENNNLEAAKTFNPDFIKQHDAITAKIEKLNNALLLIQESSDELNSQEFDWKLVANRAIEIQRLIHEKDPIALKAAYQSIFEKIIVGPIDNEGRRSLNFVLKSEPSGGGRGRHVNRAETICFDEKLAQEEGLEPPTKRLTAACSTD